jgi:hypothetical protein
MPRALEVEAVSVVNRTSLSPAYVAVSPVLICRIFDFAGRDLDRTFIFAVSLALSDSAQSISRRANASMNASGTFPDRQRL